jgi:NitT/TauT family transport system substrate-binding protein
VDLNSEWASVSPESALVTGVTVVRKDILENYPDMVEIFLKESGHGVENVYSDPAAAAELIVNMGIVGKAVIAEQAIPYCNMVCIRGAGMKDTLSGYLQTLFAENSKAVGAEMPDDAFYYTGE